MIFHTHFISKKIDLIIAGVDEVGCGALVGPVVAAAVILYPHQLIHGLADSKVLNKNSRLRLYKDITRYALTWSLGYANVLEINQLNILNARLLAIKRAVDNLSILPDLILIDGNHAPRFEKISYQCFRKGDVYIPIISAASIIAKVTRDQDMNILDKKYPKYKFSQNKGYPTVFHLKQLKLYGPTSHHRKKFSPIKYML